MIKLFVLVLTPFLASAQLTPNSVTVTATRPGVNQPDIVRFSVSISSAADATREEVVAAAGMATAQFTGVSYYFSSANLPLTWTFSLTAPLANLRATLGLLTALQNSLTKDKKFGLSFSVVGTEVSPQSRDCALPDLIADARSQAAKLASAAGMIVGAVQAISGSTNSAPAIPAGFGGVTTTSSPTCAITVRFALVGGF